MFVGVGMPVFCLAARMPPRTYRMFVYPALLFAFVTLIAVLVPGIGVLNYNARRWIELGPLPFQPSEAPSSPCCCGGRTCWSASNSAGR